MSDMEFRILDLLVDGDSSFAALLLGLRRHWGHTEVNIVDVLDVLRALEDRGLVHASQMEPDGSFRSPTEDDHERARRDYSTWLPQATASEAAVDEVGLWYEIKESGRVTWSRWPGSEVDDRDRWVLDDRADQGILEVRASRDEVAEAALNTWLAEHGDEQVIPGSKARKKIPSFVTRDGSTVVDGVLVTCRYRTKKQ